MTAKAELKLRPAKTSGRTLADFRSAHDKSFIVPNKIRAGLKRLGVGWDYELSFVKMCELSLTDFAAYREMFEDHFLVTPGNKGKRVWSGSKETIQKMQEMV